MAPRPRKKGYEDLPPHLYYSTERGYIIRLVNGKRASLGRNKQQAIEVALEYNRQARGSKTSDVVGRLFGAPEGDNTPFAEQIKLLQPRIESEKEYAQATLNDLRNDFIRALEFFTMPAQSINLETVNNYLRTYHANVSNNVFNRKVGFLQKLFAFAMDESYMQENPAMRKRLKPKEKKIRQRLTLEAFRSIHAIAPEWLKTAMDLSLQTTHARLEVTRIEYKLKAPAEGRCGIVWLKQPEFTPQGTIYGTLYIHRQKVEKYEASHVAIPVGQRLKEIIDNSRDSVLCPFVVHRVRKRDSQLSKEITHRCQVAPDYLSRAFSKYRDQTGLFNGMPMEQRPTFHEIRALAGKLFKDAGIDPQSRMAHTDAKSTKIYTENHREWVKVPHGEIAV